MTTEQALIIKSWRVELECSWRRVAELAVDYLKMDIRRGHQIDGMNLCNQAQKLLKEENDLWN